MFSKVFFAARHFRVASPPANCSKNLPQPHTLPQQRVLLVVIFSKSESRDKTTTWLSLWYPFGQGLALCIRKVRPPCFPPLLSNQQIAAKDHGAVYLFSFIKIKTSAKWQHVKSAQKKSCHLAKH